MARLVPLDHGTGDTRIRHPQAEVQVLLLLRPEPENGRCQDQHDLRAGQMAAARRGDRLYRGGNAHVRRVAGITPHTHTHIYTQMHTLPRCAWDSNGPIIPFRLREFARHLHCDGPAARLFTRLTFSRSKHPALGRTGSIYIYIYIYIYTYTRPRVSASGERQTEIAGDDTTDRSEAFVSKFEGRSKGLSRRLEIETDVRKQAKRSCSHDRPRNVCPIKDTRPPLR